MLKQVQHDEVVDSAIPAFAGMTATSSRA